MNTVRCLGIDSSNAIIFKEAVILRRRRHDIQQNDVHHNDSQYVGSVVMLSVAYAE